MLRIEKSHLKEIELECQFWLKNTVLAPARCKDSKLHIRAKLNVKVQFESILSQKLEKLRTAPVSLIEGFWLKTQFWLLQDVNADSRQMKREMSTLAQKVQFPAPRCK